MWIPKPSAFTVGNKRIEKRDEPGLALPELRLRHAIPFSLAGQLAYILSQMGVLSALAHFRGPEEVGEFGLALALTTPAFMFVNMGCQSSQASDVTQRYSFAEYAGLVLCLAVLATFASIGAGFLFANTIDSRNIVIVIALTKAAESISNLSYGAFQQAGRVDKVAISMTLRGVFTLALFVFLLWMGVETALAFLAQLTVWSLLALGRDYRLASGIAAGKFVWPTRNVARILKLGRETLPLGGSYMVNSLLVSLPRLFVEHSVGLAAVGLLTVVNYIQQAGSLLLGAMSPAIVNHFSRLRNGSPDRAMRGTVRSLLVFISLCSLGGVLLAIFAGEWMLTLVFGPKFAAAEGLLVLIALALCARFYGIIPQSLLHAQRRFKTFLFREVAAVILCVAFLVVCVPLWGLIGAGYAILAAAIFRLVIMCVATSRLGMLEKAPTDAVCAASPGDVL